MCGTPYRYEHLVCEEGDYCWKQDEYVDKNNPCPGHESQMACENCKDNRQSLTDFLDAEALAGNPLDQGL